MKFDRLKRRQFISLLGGAAVSLPVVARAQQGGPIKRVGFLTLLSSKDEEGVLAAFRDGLRSRGLIEGKDLKLDYRYSEGSVKRLTPLAQELLALRPDVLVGGEPSPTKVLKSIAPALPIVCPQLTDAQLSDLMASYARPGGTVTGVAQTVEGMTGKLIELVQEFVPGAVRVGFLSNPTGASMQFFAHSTEEAARSRGILLLIEQATTPDDLAPALGSLARQQAQAIIVPLNGLFRNEVAQIVRLATAARLPTIFAQRHGAEAGGLAARRRGRSRVARSRRCRWWGICAAARVWPPRRSRLHFARALTAWALSRAATSRSTTNTLKTKMTGWRRWLPISSASQWP